MLRKVQTSQGRRKFFHEQSRTIIHLNNQITRPPTSHPYSKLRNVRSQQGINKYEYFQSNHSYQNMLEVAVKPKHKNQFKIKQGIIPKVFGHIITQIKVLLKHQNYDSEALNSMFDILVKKINEMHLENESYMTKFQQKSSQMISLNLQIQELNKKLKKYEASINENRYLSNKQNTKNIQYQLLLQNTKLAQLNEAYRLKLNQLDQRKDSNRIQIRKQNNEHENTQILRCHNRLAYLEIKLKNNEERQIQLAKEIQELESIKKKNQEQILDIKMKNQQLNQKLNQSRERAFMQNEDSQMHMMRQNFLLFSIKKLRQSNKSLTDKLINQRATGQDVKRNDIEPNPYFQYQIDFFKNIKTIYFDHKYKEFKLTLNNKDYASFENTNFELEEQYVQYRKHEQICLSNYSYYMPSFFSFIEQSITNQISTCRIKGNSSVSRIFIQHVRGILNSKINEFIMFSSEEKYTKFPEFVFTWFEKFYFNSQKCDVCALEPYMQKPFPQDLFYRDLMNIKLDQSWQIITFRQFILEELSLQDLYFYLMCQNLLFKRAGITKEKQYLGQFCILVEYNAVKSVLDMVLSDFQSWNLGYLTTKLREKIIFKKNVQFIESGFFLRSLIQYYKIERINRYKYISKLCDQFKSCEKGLRFSSFISIINRFTEVTIDQKIKLYRQCFSVSQGKITADVIFTVCTEKLIFLKYLKLKCFYRLPMVISQKSMKGMQRLKSKKSNLSAPVDKKSIICIQPPDPYLYRIYMRMMKILKIDSQFNKKVDSLGLVDLSHNISLIQRTFNDNNPNGDSSILKCRHFMHYLSEILNKIKTINYYHLYQLLEQQGKKKVNANFWVQINQKQLCEIFQTQFTATLSVYDKLADYVSRKNRIYTFRLNHAARKIQRQVRKKFIAPFVELYKIIYSEFKDGQNKGLKEISKR